MLMVLFFSDCNLMSDFYYTRNDKRKNMLLVTNDIETDECE